MGKIQDIEDHMAYTCDECGCSRFNLLKSGEIACSECENAFGHWNGFNPGTYHCAGCMELTSMNETTDCSCGKNEWIRTPS